MPPLTNEEIVARLDVVLRKLKELQTLVSTLQDDATPQASASGVDSTE